MKLKLITAALGALLLGACASNPAVPVQTPAQVAAIACPDIQAAISTLEPLYRAQPALADQADQLVAAAPKVAAVCQLASVANLQQLASQILPTLLPFVQSPPLTPAQVAAIDVGIVAAQVALQAYGAPTLAAPAVPAVQ